MAKIISNPKTHFLNLISVDTGSLILGYLEAIVASLSIVILIVYIGLCQRDLEMNDVYDSYPTVALASTVLILSAAVTLLGLILTVAVLLIIGVQKRNKGYVLTYYIIGVIKSALMFFTWLIFMVLGAPCEITIAVFLALVVHTIWLSMVHSVYHNICLEQNPNSMSYNNLDENIDIIKKKEIV